jgi:hypothetical protein
MEGRIGSGIGLDVVQRIGVQRRATTCRAATERLKFPQFYHDQEWQSESTPAATACWAASAT